MASDSREIIVVDDEPGVNMIFSRILNDMNFSARYFSSAEDAVSYLRNGQDCSMAFLDIRLPGMDGIQALSKFREIAPGMKVVMMTAYQTVESIVTAMKLGAVDYLVKPLDPQMIAKSVEKYYSLGSIAIEQESESSDGIRFAQSQAMSSMLSTAEKFAKVDEPVLLLGESGTGKEFFAQYIHSRSRRSQRPLVMVDCASIPESLFESELFGYEKGAFTGADASKIGRFQLADGGTLFLDEIGNVPLAMQAKLLRFIEDKTLMRLGGKKTITLDIRIVAATNADLRKTVAAGQFREDLFYRLGALTLQLLPLRNRSAEEISSLLAFFLEENKMKLKKSRLTLSDLAQKFVREYPWPGNVRELKHALYSAALLCDTGVIELTHFPIGIQSYFSHRAHAAAASMGENKTMREILKKVEKEQILSTLKKTGGNKKKASEMLDMDYKSFLTKLKEYSPDAGSEPDQA